MTREEFMMPGWVLLTTQKWGRIYDLATREGQVQGDYYYGKFKDVDAATWTKVCDSVAEGDHWPPVSELRPMIENLRPKRRTLTDQRKGEGMPPEVRELLRKLTAKMKDMPGEDEGT